MLQLLVNHKMFQILLAATMPQDFFGGIVYIVEKYAPLFLNGLINTLIIALLGTLFGLILGLFIAGVRQIKITARDHGPKRLLKKLSQWISIAYIQYLRGTPMLVQGMMVYFGLRKAGVPVSPLVTAVFIVSINTSAYMAEILRASIQAIDPGQMEAARAIGMTETQGMMYFVLPQAFRNAIPAIGNEFVVNTKDSSVLNNIMVAELFYQANQIGATHYRYIEPLFVISLIYLTITIISTKILNMIEKKMDAPKNTYPTSTTHKEHHFGRLTKGSAK